MLITFERIDSKRETAIMEAFTVATCARELNDMIAATCALRVIDAYLHNRTPRQCDVAIIETYFR
jgi:NADH:ubiquinone oxidoreductase subunit B-like Fe-S oxidoreductase